MCGCQENLLAVVLDGVCPCMPAIQASWVLMRFRPGASRRGKATAPTGVEWLAAALGPELGVCAVAQKPRTCCSVSLYNTGPNYERSGNHAESTLLLRSLLHHCTSFYMFGALAVFVSDEVPRRRGSLFAQDLGGCCPQIHSGCRTGLWNSVFFPWRKRTIVKRKYGEKVLTTKRSYFTRCHIIPQDIFLVNVSLIMPYYQ